MNKIWKLQRPLVIESDQVFVMAYTENKQKMAMLPVGQEVVGAMFGDDLKIYVKATVKNGVLKIKRRVPDQEW